MLTPVSAQRNGQRRDFRARRVRSGLAKSGVECSCLTRSLLACKPTECKKRTNVMFALQRTRKECDDRVSAGEYLFLTAALTFRPFPSVNGAPSMFVKDAMSASTVCSNGSRFRKEKLRCECLIGRRATPPFEARMEMTACSFPTCRHFIRHRHEWFMSACFEWFMSACEKDLGLGKLSTVCPPPSAMFKKIGNRCHLCCPKLNVVPGEVARFQLERQISFTCRPANQ